MKNKIHNNLKMINQKVKVNKNIVLVLVLIQTSNQVQTKMKITKNKLTTKIKY